MMRLLRRLAFRFATGEDPRCACVGQDMLEFIKATIELKKVVGQPIQKMEKSLERINAGALKVWEAARNLKEKSEERGKEAL